MEFKVNSQGLWLSIFLRLISGCIIISIVISALVFITNDFSTDNFYPISSILKIHLWVFIFCIIAGSIYSFDIKSTKIHIDDDTLYYESFLGIKRTMKLKNIRRIYNHGFIADNITIEDCSLFSSYRRIIIYKRTENLEELFKNGSTNLNHLIANDIFFASSSFPLGTGTKW